VPRARVVQPNVTLRWEEELGNLSSVLCLEKGEFPQKGSEMTSK
jgi:hypothetical protein